MSPVANPRYKLYRPEHEPVCLGLLTAEPLPPYGPFYLHSPCGLVRVSLVGGGGRVPVDAALLDEARAFHTYACEHVLQVISTREKIFSGSFHLTYFNMLTTIL